MIAGVDMSLEETGGLWEPGESNDKELLGLGELFVGCFIE